MFGAFLKWVVKGDTGEPTSLEKLTAERDRLERQIEVLEAGPVNYRDVMPQNASLLADLKEARAELQGQIASAGQAQPPRA